MVGAGGVVTLPYYAQVPSQARRVASLAGVGFVEPDIRAGFAATFPTSEGLLRAAPGDELAFVSAEAYSFSPPFGQTGLHYGPPNMILDPIGRPVAAPLTSSEMVSGVAGSMYQDSGVHYVGRWVIEVPRGAALRLSASRAGFTQTVDLRSGEHVGPAPEVLYRAPTGQ